MPLPTTFEPGILELPLFDDEHRALAQRIERWCAERADTWAHPTEVGPAQRCRALLTDLGRSGWLDHLHPEHRDGSDLRSVCIRRQALSFHEDLADFVYSIQELSAAAVIRHGTAEQRRRHLPGLAAGTSAGALALSEPAAGSDLGAVTLEAATDGTGFVLNGSKTWIAQGDIADLCVVLARTGDGPGPLGLTAFLVDGDTPGLKAAPINAIAPRSWAELTFTDCRVGPDAILGERGHGYIVALDVLERARVTVAAAAIGFARRAYRYALERARGRRAYSGRLADLQLVKSALSAMEVKIAAATLLTARAAWSADHGEEYAKHAAVAKLNATEAAGEIADAAVQIFGAAGLVADSPVERLYRQVRSLRIYEGPSEVLEMIIADAL
ncbi:acyl-CoA dehydrogenase family protein [Nocardia arthritidis]|uniref:Acyl-CoA dehydrogenase n=1 Tax=Nocardia arthritidis TaxID=228602 RepID=A0A6G9YBW5_9NOCA|nr:acyl-CoA dehydrogenase family protein [Nocardia arthritidis]QIS10719.1 acyl-CoA dehydrogenase [Nocardia arthritidis]